MSTLSPAIPRLNAEATVSANPVANPSAVSSPAFFGSFLTNSVTSAFAISGITSSMGPAAVTSAMSLFAEFVVLSSPSANRFSFSLVLPNSSTRVCTTLNAAVVVRPISIARFLTSSKSSPIDRMMSLALPRLKLAAAAIARQTLTVTSPMFLMNVPARITASTMVSRFSWTWAPAAWSASHAIVRKPIARSVLAMRRANDSSAPRISGKTRAAMSLIASEFFSTSSVSRANAGWRMFSMTSWSAGAIAAPLARRSVLNAIPVLESAPSSDLAWRAAAWNALPPSDVSARSASTNCSRVSFETSLTPASSRSNGVMPESRRISADASPELNARVSCRPTMSASSWNAAPMSAERAVNSEMASVFWPKTTASDRAELAICSRLNGVLTVSRSTSASTSFAPSALCVSTSREIARLSNAAADRTPSARKRPSPMAAIAPASATTAAVTAVIAPPSRANERATPPVRRCPACSNRWSLRSAAERPARNSRVLASSSTDSSPTVRAM